MKKFLVILMVVAMASFLFVGCLPTTNTAPVITSTPGETATVGTEYSYTVIATDADDDTLTYSVSPSDLAIAANVITWTPAAVGTMDVIVTVTDGTDPVTQTFTITVSAAVVPDVVITTAAILGVTAPVTGATPVTTITAATQYTGTVTWSSTPTTFAASTAYTATITLTPTTGYTLTGVAANLFTVAGATSDTNPVNSGVVTAVFPATAAAVVTAAEAVAAVKDAAIVLNLATWTTADEIAAFLDALADANFTGYLAVNDVAYVAEVSTFTAVTTVALVDAAIKVVNTAQTAATAVAAVNVATTSVALNAALADTAFTGYLAANSAAYYAAIATFSATLTPTVAKVDAAIKVVNTAEAATAAVAAVNAALTQAALNTALANAAFTSYVPANYLSYKVVKFSTALTPTLAKVNTAILAANVVAADTAVDLYVAVKDAAVTDTTILTAVASLAGDKEGATAAVAALPAGTAKTAHLATIAATDVLITTAATISTVVIGAANYDINAAINTQVAVTAVAKNASGYTLTTGVTYAWTVTTALSTPGGSYVAAITDLAFSDATIAAPIITKALAKDKGDSYTITVAATKASVKKTDTATVTVK